ncbi:MAG: hypothetical protein ABIP14_09820 [Blastocatellia bacterium]
MKRLEEGAMTVFTINETEFCWEEIVAAAQSWGEWLPFVAEERQSLACLGYAAKNQQQLPENEVRAAATTFRYAHNLISAEETQAWLNRREMTAEDWMNWLRGKLLRERWADRLNEILAAHPVSDEEVAEVLKHHAVCAGKLSDWAIKLAGHAAIVAKSGLFDAGQCPLDGATGSSRDLVFRIESEFERQWQMTVTPKLIESKIADHRLDWIHFDCRSLWFAEERMAREAAWCVTEDGLTIDEVARQAHAEVKYWAFYLDEIDAAIRPYFMAARQGDSLGPLKMTAQDQIGFPFFSIVEKKMPAIDDPKIRQRAEKTIIANLMEQAMNEQVKWDIF